jgi:hypothetical protein
MAIPNLYCACPLASGWDLDQNFSGYPSKWLALGKLFWSGLGDIFRLHGGFFSVCSVGLYVNLLLSFHTHESSLHRVFTFCIVSLPYFCWLFAFVLSLGCVYLCSHLPCAFDGWLPILDYYLQGFTSLRPIFIHLVSRGPYGNSTIRSGWCYHLLKFLLWHEIGEFQLFQSRQFFKLSVTTIIWKTVSNLGFSVLPIDSTLDVPWSKLNLFILNH